MSTATRPVEPDAPDRSTDPITPVRASDAERADVVALLHEALGTGRLDLAETDERVAAAYAARFRHELAALVRDLPGSAAAENRSGSDKAKAALRAISARAAKRPLVVAAALLIGVGGIGGAAILDDGPSGPSGPPGVVHMNDDAGPHPR
jgi:hypothetical protein